MVYILLINYNEWKHTLECISSILKNSYQNFRIVIIDNNSNADREFEIEFFNIFMEKTKIILAKSGQLTDFNIENKQIILIKNDRNDGFAAACNCAFSFIRRQSDYEYVWLLGCDNVIEKESLNNLVKYMKKSNEIGLCGSISLDFYQKDFIQCAGIGIYNKWTSRIKHLFNGKSKDYLNKVKIEEIIKKTGNQILYVYGNTMFFSKKFFSSLLYLPEMYFIYFEELEIMKLLEQANLKFGVATDSIVYHKEGMSTGGNSRNKSYISDYYSKRNRILFTKKYYKYCLPTVYLALCFVILQRIKTKQFDRVWMIFKLMLNPYLKLNER